MKISIITTSLNQRAYIPEAMESVRAQDYPEIEHLVVDGLSTDGTVAWLQHTMHAPEWEHVRWQSERDGGQSNAMNKGFLLATGEIIGWLNSDDRYRPQTLTRVAQFFKEHPEIDIVYGDYTLMDETGKILTPRREISFSRFILLHHRVLYIPTTSTFFRRRILDEGHLLDESLHYAMDHEFFVRLASRGYRFQHIAALLADFRLHDESKTCTSAHKQLAEVRITRLRFSQITRIRPQILSVTLFTILRKAAAIMRYSEKLLRGYYWTQRNPKAFGH